MIRRFIEYIRDSLFWRNVVLAVCAAVVFICLVNLILNLYTRHGQQHPVPDFIGMSLPQAEKAARKFSLDLEIADSLYVPGQARGSVLEQYPKAGSNVKSGRRIFLTINSIRPKMVEIPYVTGFSLRQAKNRLLTAGFVIERLIYKSDIATNNVLEQRYDGRLVTSGAGTMGEMGSGVVLIVGMNPTDPAPVVPKVTGLTVDQARSRLWEAGFNVGAVTPDGSVRPENEARARVYGQSPGQVTHSHYGKEVALQVTADEEKVAEGVKAAEKEAARYLQELKEAPDSLETTGADEYFETQVP